MSAAPAVSVDAGRLDTELAIDREDGVREAHQFMLGVSTLMTPRYVRDQGAFKVGGVFRLVTCYTIILVLGAIRDIQSERQRWFVTHPQSEYPYWSTAPQSNPSYTQ